MSGMTSESPAESEENLPEPSVVEDLRSELHYVSVVVEHVVVIRHEVLAWQECPSYGQVGEE